MGRKSGNINWSDELAVSVRLVGKAILRFFGWVLSIVMTLCLIGVITGVIVGGAFLLYAKDNIDTSVDDFADLIKDKDLTTRVGYLDADGKYVDLPSESLSAGEKRSWVKYSDFNEYIADAFVVIEDKRFEQHKGVDWLSTIKVTIQYFTGQGMRGASTITQQVIKNVTENDDVTIQRKAQEILKALNLEKKYDKTEILEMYLNSIYLSQGCYGVGAAAYTYFGKEVKDLTLIESAALACITQYPYYYDPIINPQHNAEKRNLVLKYMYDQGKITQDEFLSAYEKELVLKVSEDDDEDTSASVHSWYTDAAQQEAVRLLRDKFGYSARIAEKALLTGGYTIVTALDPDIQAIVEDYYENAEWEKHDNSPIQPNSSCVIIDHSNGNVVALVGSRGRKTINLGLNYATQTRRPSGSSIKPISVYGPGIEANAVTWGTVLDDVPINFGTETINPDTGEKVYSNKHGYPKNAPDRYLGLTTVHEGVRNSINTISWRSLERLGLDNSFDFLTNKLHLTTLIESQTMSNGLTFTDKAYAPLAMGEFTWGVVVKEMVAAYQIFANEGIFNDERIVLKILDNDGNVIVDNEKKSEVVISAQTATITTKLLQDVVATGTAYKITLKKNVDCAGKTGTSESNNDKWFIGYTPYYVCGVWFGYSMPRSLNKFNSVSSAPVLAWDAIMTKVMQKYVDAAKNGGEPLKKFVDAPGLVQVEYCIDSGKLPTDACRNDLRKITEPTKGNRIEKGWFKAGTEPTEYCDCHVMVEYDKVKKAVAMNGCPSENTIKVGMLNHLRVLPFNIQIADAQYTWQQVPDDYSYEGLTSSQPFYIKLLPAGFYTGYTKNGGYYNHACLTHIKTEPDPPVTEPVIPDPVIPVEPAA
ncbi:MAG: transglycosylase domain-containing protein [Firmicutes bacterium]|uniref:Transglycosylase domain-containing protein n=1 Tax=Candidatus Colimorpha enterica TaxID=3083063 RepID=A0AAE3FIN4_9BACT|nr:transglycosylase domain-containing protein [Candidatus Colimorpha enterica]MDD6322821.1 transglycosylase domain-containing protein [Bacillota bacterium]